MALSKIKVDIEVGTESLDRAIAKAKFLVDLLREAQEINDSLSGKDESEGNGTDEDGAIN